MAGLGDSGIKAALGLKSLVTDLSDDDKLALKQMKLEAEADPRSGYRTVGDITGNIAATLIPGAKAAQGVGKVVSALPSALRWLAPGLTGAAVSGAQGVALTPSESDGAGNRLADKLVAGGKDAAVGGVLGQGGKILAKTLTKPFQASPEAEKLFAQGVNPTLQQGADSAVGRFVGGLTAGITKSRDRHEEEVADALLHRTTDGKVNMEKGTGANYFEAARGYVSGLYDDVLGGKIFPISPTTRKEAAAAASKLNKQKQFVQEAQDASKIVGNILGDSKKNVNVNSKTLRDDFLTPLSRKAYAAGDDETKRRILATRDVLIEKARTQRLTPEEQALLKEADIKQFDVARLREATTGVSGTREGTKIDRLASSYGNMRQQAAKMGNATGEELIFPASRVLGSAPNQDMSRQGLIAAARVVGGLGLTGGGALAAGSPLTAAAAAGLYGVSALGQTKGGARYLMGQNDWQKRLAEYLRQAAPYAAGAGNTLTPENPQ
jgi:hypothetical protein